MIIRKLFKFENKPWRFAKQMFIQNYHLVLDTRQAKPHQMLIR